MIIQVRLLTGYQKPLWYKIPSDWPMGQTDSDQLIGRLVYVPLRARKEYALIEQIVENPGPMPFEIKPAFSLATFPDDDSYHTYIQRLSSYYACEPLTLYQRLHAILKYKEPKPESDSAPFNEPSKVVTLTNEQQAVVDFIKPHITAGTYVPTLLHGVTGSGKTECYKKLIEHAYAQGKTALLLLPEVTLATQFMKLLSQQLPSHIPLFSFHSATGQAEKRALWKALVENKPVCIIGVHLPIFLPISNLGCIIVDEEHEIGYQEKKHPKINSKEAALLRAQTYSIPILLGSATPSMSSLYNTHAKKWKFFELKTRFSGTFPKVKTVLLSNKEQRRTHFWISNELEAALRNRLSKGEQAIIFLNRRGFSFFVQCTMCTFVCSCNTCSVSLTLHEDDSLRCHYCGFKTSLPPECSSCHASASNFLKKGLGTQQVVSILQKMFPSARIARADMDTTVNKKKWQQLTDAFTKGQLDIIVGTQTITKGYDFPGVTLVGILWADLNIHFPVYNAAEHTLQQLIQVAGRAGRHQAESEVIVQTMIEHPIFSYLCEVDYPLYYEYEMKKRSMLGYPPSKRLAEIEAKHEDRAVVVDDMEHYAARVQQFIEHHKLDMQILGPAEPPVHKINNVCSMKLYIKGADARTIAEVFKKLDVSKYSSSFYFTPNPLS